MHVRALTRIALLALVTVFFLVSRAGALQLTYELTGVNLAGDPVSARASFSTTGGLLSIDLTNLQGNPENIGQNFTGVSFTLSTFQAEGALQSGPPNTQQNVLANGQVQGLPPVVGVATGWSLQQHFDNGLGDGMKVCVLCAGGDGPHTLIGPPSGGLYSAADGSIAGSATNNPFFNNVLHLVIDDVPGLTSATYVDSAFFYFGGAQQTLLQAHCIVSCLPERQNVPEPSSLLLVGAGLLGLAGFSLRKRLNTK